MYGAALEALELRENSPMSFLNVGSGTGYMNCIVAVILGPYSTNYGIEIHEDVIEHCENAISRWQTVYRGKVPHMQLIHGNALNISMNEGEALVGFDRIYIGASISRTNVSALTSLLKPGGILVGPGKSSFKRCSIRLAQSQPHFDLSQIPQSAMSLSKSPAGVSPPVAEEVATNSRTIPSLVFV